MISTTQLLALDLESVGATAYDSGSLMDYSADGTDEAAFTAAQIGGAQE
jgi:hypothetical protein